MEDPTLGSWSIGNKGLSCKNAVLWGILVYHDHFGQLSLSVGLGILSLQLVCFVILNVVGNFENSYRCTALIKHPFPQWCLKGITYAKSWSIKFCAPPILCQSKIPSIPPSWTCLFGLAQTLWFKLKMWLLSMCCIAWAFGKHGYTNVHSHETPYPYLSCLVMSLPHGQRCRDGT
jgi:hypothetical protein